MIYTLTLNPAIDVFSRENKLVFGKINTITNQEFCVGGKGINVSLALKRLGVISKPITILGGFTGRFIEEVLKEEFEPYIIKSENPTRINFKICSSECETAFNMKSKSDFKAIVKIKEYIDTLTVKDLLIVSGSGDVNDYKFLLEDIKCKLILDVNGKLLKELIKYNPFIIKPNLEELLEFNSNIEMAYKELLKNTEIIINTLGDKGAKIITKNERYEIGVIGNEIISTVGCGDSFLAGFVYSYLNGNNLKECLEFSSKCAYYKGHTGEYYKK